MSNWSAVVVSWSGWEPGRHDVIARSITNLYESRCLHREGEISGRWQLYPAYSTMALRKATDSILIGSENFFDIDQLMDTLRDIVWEFPAEVLVLWKNEDMIRWGQVGLEDWLLTRTPTDATVAPDDNDQGRSP